MSDKNKGQENKDSSRLIAVVIIIISILAIIVIKAMNEDSSSKNTSSVCTIEKYRTSAQPIMSSFSSIITNISLSNDNDVRQAIGKLDDLLSDANRVYCRQDFPLKHETLVYSIIHMKDAFQYALDDKLVDMQQSINKSELNVNRYRDWSVDVGK